jgi:hypothetical protein
MSISPDLASRSTTRSSSRSTAAFGTSVCIRNGSRVLTRRAKPFRMGAGITAKRDRTPRWWAHASFGVCGTDPGRCPGAVFARLKRRTPSWSKQEIKLRKAQEMRQLILDLDQLMQVDQRIAAVVRIRVSGERPRVP